MMVFETAKEWFDWFQARPATRRFYRAIPTDRVERDPKPGVVDGQAFAPEASYFSVRIVDLHLKNAGEYFRNFLPVGVVLSEFTAGGQTRAQPFFLNTDRLKQALGTAGDGLGFVQMQNVYALKYVPVNANGLSLFCGIVRVQHQDFAAALLDLVAEIGGQVALPTIGQGVDLAKAVYTRLGKLVGMSGVEYRFGHLDGSCLDHGAGYRVFAGAPEREPLLDDLSIVEGRLCHRNGGKSIRPVTEFDYCVLAVERLETRATVALLTTLPLHQQWKKVVPLLTGNKAAEAEAEFVKLQSEILLTPDLTEEDRLVALSVYQKKWADVRSRIQLGDAAPKGTRSPAAESLRAGLTIEAAAIRKAGNQRLAKVAEVLIDQLQGLAVGRAEDLSNDEISGVRNALKEKAQGAPMSAEVANLFAAARLRSRSATRAM
jgi:hypothetical protein